MPRTRATRPAATLALAALFAGCTGLGGPSPDPVVGDLPVAPPVVHVDETGSGPAPGRPSAAFEYLVASELAREGRYDEALAAYLRVLAIDPDAPVWLPMADLALKLNRPEEAIEFAERAWEGGNREIGLRLFLGSLYAERLEVDAARELLTDDDGDPASPDAAVVLSSAYFQAGRLEAARDARAAG